MTRSGRLRPIQNFNDAKVQSAASTLGMRQEELRNQQERLLQLTTYREEYGRDFRLHGEISRDPAWMRNYQYFLAQLNDGIVAQEQIVAECKKKMLEAQRHWSELSKKASALDNAVDRMRKEELRAADKKEQAQIDEQVQSRWRNED